MVLSETTNGRLVVSAFVDAVESDLTSDLRCHVELEVCAGESCHTWLATGSERSQSRSQSDQRSGSSSSSQSKRS